MPHRYSASGSDGDFAGVMGITALDGLGPAETLEKPLGVKSLPERGGSSPLGRCWDRPAVRLPR